MARMRHAGLVVIGGLVTLLVGPRVARACEMTSPGKHQVDAAARAADHVAPGTPTLEAVSVTRGRSGSRGSCADSGMIKLRLRATDDHSRPFEMGYRVEIVRGALPAAAKAAVPQHAMRRVAGAIWMHWRESARDLPPFDVTFKITAIDLAGNASAAPLVVRVSDDGFATPRPGTFTVATATTGCTRGDAPACTWLGKRYAHGAGVPRDAAKADALYDQACRGGDALACDMLASMRRTNQSDGGAEFMRLEAEAVRLNTEACRQRHDALACFERGWQASRHGQDDERADAWLAACEAGVDAACDDDRWLVRDETGPRPARLAAALRARCERGAAEACLTLALAASSPIERRELLARACRAGSTLACLDQADERLAEDPRAASQAAVSYATACARDADEQACLLAEALAVLAHAKASSPAVVTALQALEQRCRTRGEFCAHLALRYAQGVLVAKDPARAKALRERACQTGHASSCAR